MRFTARDGKGGTNSDDIVLTLAAGHGPVPRHLEPGLGAGGAQASTVTWDVAGTDANGINTANVKISLSTDGGQTFPTVLAASTPNDGSQSVTFPNTATTTARIKVEAIGNVFFDVNNTNFTIAQDTTPPVTTATLSTGRRRTAPTAGTSARCRSRSARPTASRAWRRRTTRSTAAPTQTYTGPFTISDRRRTRRRVLVDRQRAATSSRRRRIDVKIDLNTPTSSASISPAPAERLVRVADGDADGRRRRGLRDRSHLVQDRRRRPVPHVHGPAHRVLDRQPLRPVLRHGCGGRVESTVNLVAFKADAVKPTVNVTRPAEGASFPLDKVVTAAYKCADNQSGLASCVGHGRQRRESDTSTIGSHTFTVTGTDKAGNVTVVTTHYTVDVHVQRVLQPDRQPGRLVAEPRARG